MMLFKFCDSIFCVCCGYEIIVRHFLFKLPSIKQDILKQIKAFLCEYGIIFLSILLKITIYNDGNCFDICFWKLRCNDVCNLRCTVRIDIFKPFLNSICKMLYCIRVGL